MSDTQTGGSHLDDALNALRAGELVVFPTETFYGIAADAYSEKALARLVSVKGRELGKPIALIAADPEMAFSLGREVPLVARKLAEVFWPGPLTLVFPARAGLSPEIVGVDGVGVRVSSHPIARALSRGLGRPITATSANPAGGAPSRSTDEARSTCGSKIKVFVEGGSANAGAASTVLVVLTTGRCKLIREGAIGRAQIAEVIGLEALT